MTVSALLVGGFLAAVWPLPSPTLGSAAPPSAAAQGRSSQSGATESASAPSSQGPNTQELPPGVAARVGNEVVTFDEYEAHLVRTLGRRPLQELIDTRLIEGEAARLQISVPAEELDGEVERFWQSMLVRHQGQVAGLQADLAAEGFLPEEYRASFRARRRVELLADRICVALRTPDEAAIRERFEREFGVGGARVEVRHILLNAARLRSDLVRAGVDVRELTPEEIERRVEETARQTLERLSSGADFVEVAREVSHDISVHTNDGMIQHYNYRRYGETLAQAVRSAEIGTPFGPVRTPAGLHIVEVLARTQFNLEDVRDEVLGMLRADPASGTELQALRLRLRVENPVQIY